jgi:hypothetical protein
MEFSPNFSEEMWTMILHSINFCILHIHWIVECICVVRPARYSKLAEVFNDNDRRVTDIKVL